MNRLHAKLGDLWWYSLMIFAACRLADVMNVFVGLYLVPKYVGPNELGAVMPLTNFAAFLAFPAAVFATTFMKEVNTLATRGEYGQMKTLMRGVFIGVGAFLIVALVATRLLMPLFLQRIRIAEGSLGILIIASSFIGTVSPVYQNALQALKKFKTISFINIVGAPIRLIAMVVTMPFRPLSGYFVGQAATPAFNIFASLFALRRELSVKAERYWSVPVFRRLSLLFLGIAAYQFSGGLSGLVEQTVLRQRLPDVDSAAYYMVSRFSEIAGFVSGTLLLILFPLTAELAEKGKDTKPLVIKSSLGMIIASALLALFFAIFGRSLLTLLPNGDAYCNYAWAIPWLIGISVLGGIQGFYVNTEISAARFGFLKWWIPLHVLYPVLMLVVSGHGYFAGHVPATWTDFLLRHNITSLSAMLWWMTGIALVRCLFCLRALFVRKSEP